MSSRVGLKAIAVGLVLASAASFAHHGQAGLFDEAQILELHGSVKEWSFVNPHPVLLIEVADARGEQVSWDVYFGPAAVAPLRRRGFTADTFKPGDAVIVKGHPATAKGSHGIDVWGADTSVTRGDGSPIP